MAHDTSLIATISVGLAYAFVGGYTALRLGLPPLVGYLLAGIAVGPFTPGFVADVKLAPQLAEIGVILLMFGVGMHFSIADLWAVKSIAVPGALAQIAAATGMGIGLASWWGWPFGSGFVFGLALSVASTVVLLRALEDRGKLDSTDGRIAVGWLIVEDLVMVLTLVLLPALAKRTGDDVPLPDKIWFTVVLTLLQVGLFVAVMLLGASRVFPWVLRKVEQTGSRELFTLCVITLALGVGYASAEVFGVSFALGAFFAGIVVNGSGLSHRAAKELQPLQDAFAALFFVSVGMLFDPSILIKQPLGVLAVLAVIMFGKSVVAFIIVIGLRRPLSTALTVSVALAQIGEFSFILADLGIKLKLLDQQAQSLLVAGALLSITLNPVLFALASRFGPRVVPSVPVR